MIIELLGPPIAKRRHRSFMRNGRMTSYDPQEDDKRTVAYKLKFRKGAEEISASDMFHVELDFHLPIAKSISASARNLLSWRPVKPNKPDVDNLAKFYMDCANGILWADDSQVVSLKILKRYSEIPKTIIRIESMKPMDLDDTAKAILSLFSESAFNELIKDLTALAALHNSSEMQREDSGEIALRAACTLSRIADKYARELTKIKTKYPNYWEQQGHTAEEADYKGCGR